MSNQDKLHPLISKRWSPRTFADKAIEPQEIDLLFEAARWAASSRNEQPWRFLYATRSDRAFSDFVGCLMDGNKEWAANAAMLVSTVVKDNFDHKNLPNGHAWHDLGLAVGNLTLQAMSMDLFLHQMGGFFPDKAREILAIPEGYTPVTFLAIGYLAGAEKLPEALRERENAPRKRRELGKIAQPGHWHFEA